MKKKNSELIKYKSTEEFARSLGVSSGRVLEARMKAKLIAAIRDEIQRRKLSHEAVAQLADVSRTNITGIISGSISSVTLDRLVRIAGSLGLNADLQFKKAG